jgi:hypothetical protein
VAAARDTATNPAVLSAFALAIIAGGGPPVYPGIPGHEPDLTASRKDAVKIDKAMDELRKIVADAGSYVSEQLFRSVLATILLGTELPKIASGEGEI